MNDTNTSDISREIHELRQATRVVLVCFLIVLSYPTICLSLSLASFQQIFADMLGGGAELPIVTRFVMSAKSLFVGVSLAIPIVGVVLVFTQKSNKSLYIIGGLAFLAAVLWMLLYKAAYSPLFMIIEGMREPK